jgi:predicted RNA binding protein YcfA (HicA-like mRNA interferase family)
VTKVPSLSYHQVVSAFQRIGFRVVRQRGSHIRMEKQDETGTIKIIVPAHRPLKRSTLAKIIKDAGLNAEQFLELI